MKKPRNTPLRCKVHNGKLTIEIGVDTLVTAFLHSDYAWDLVPPANHHLRPEDLLKVRALGFARDVARELNDELGEDGSTMLTQMLDRACAEACEQGSEHVDEVKAKP